jgi:hypothetical protein
MNKVLRSVLFTSTAFMLAFSVAMPAQAQQARIALTQQMVDTTVTFLEALTPAQQDLATYSFSDEERLNWHFIPRDRNGISFNSLTSMQREPAMAVLRTFLSAKGFDKVEQIRGLEAVLAEIEVNGRFVRDPEAYFLTVFGEPSMNDTWALRFEGHHIALNWTFVEGMGIASSPQFFGTNPAEVRQGDKEGLRVLAAEEDMARELVTSLTARQLEDAIVDVEIPRDIYTAAEKEISPLDNQGIAYNTMSPSQQRLLMRLVEEIAGTQPDAIAAERMEEVRNNNTDQIRFVWIGPTGRGEPHYFRIQGAGFLIEYDNTQNNANHVHLVWRDFDGDFGRDLIRLHYDNVAAEFGPGHSH